jgi:hypothetical protein
MDARNLLRRLAAVLLLTAGLGGCVYDPVYAGYDPAYPAYSYPAYGYPAYGYPTYVGPPITLDLGFSYYHGHYSHGGHHGHHGGGRHGGHRHGHGRH